MRISDWSSDVCSSDLLNAAALGSGGGKVDFSIGESEIGAGWHLALFHPINQVLQALLNDPLKGDKPVRRRAVRLRGHQHGWRMFGIFCRTNTEILFRPRWPLRLIDGSLVGQPSGRPKCFIMSPIYPT